MDDFYELIEYLQREWAIISSAPFTFFTLAILMLGIAYTAARWRFIGIIDSLRERIDTLNEHLNTKETMVEEYRERLHIVPSKGSEYSRLSHSELKNAALKLVSDIRSWLSSIEAKVQGAQIARWNERTHAETEEERRKLWEIDSNRTMEEYRSLIAEYDQKFKIDAIVLKDEITARTPGLDSSNRNEFLYEHPTNPLGIKELVDDLEKLAKQLK